MKRFFIILFITSHCVAAFSQDAHFSQYNATRLYTNPAFAGTDSALVISSGYRNQWPKLSGGYDTYNFSADQYVGFLKGGVGLNVMHDNKTDILFNTSIDIMYSGSISLFKNKLILRPALQIGYAKSSINWGKLTFGDMVDARRGFVYNGNELSGKSSKSSIDFSTGLLIYTTRFYAGAAIHHLTNPDLGMLGPSPLPMRITLHTGADLNFKNTEFTIFPTVLWQKQDDFQMFITGVNARYKKLLFGISYRFQDAPIAMIGFQNRLFRLSYTFDYTLSDLTVEQTGGSHELQLSFFLRYQKKNVSKALVLF